MTDSPSIPHPYSEVGHYEADLGLKDAHDRMLKIILAFDAFCRRNGISYSIADGTLLGALRHGDFIPWDDDADVMVTRPEYEKIRKALPGQSEIQLVKCAFLDRVTTPAHEREGLYLDLFVNDEMPASKFLFAKKKMLSHLLRCHFVKSFQSFNFRRAGDPKLKRWFRQLVGFAVKLPADLYIGRRDVFDLNDALATIGDAPGSGIYTRLTSRMYETKRRFNKASYDAGFIDIPFRGATVMAIKNAPVFLREMYGDFENLPPESARHPVHTFNMFDLPEWFQKRYNG